MSISYTLPPQQIAAPPPGSNGSIYENSVAIAANNAQAQNNLANVARGGSRRRFKGGATGLTPAPIVVPPVQILYKDPGNMTYDNVINLTKVGATLNANSQFDACVGSSNPACGQAGGKNKKFKGGFPNWGCMSGGKRNSRRRRKSKCIRNPKKSRKCRRTKR
jgi:hypothetical protein